MDNLFVFEYGKKYPWIFNVFISIFILGQICYFFEGDKFGAAINGILFPSVCLYIFICQIFSGCALDSSWVATIDRRANPFLFYLHTAVVFVAAMCFIFLFN